MSQPPAASIRSRDSAKVAPTKERKARGPAWVRLVGTPPHPLDPLVRLGGVPVPEGRDLAGGHLLAGRRRVLRQQPLGVDEALGAGDHGVVDLVQPAQLGLEVVGPQQHVGVDEVEELALARPPGDLAGTGAAPALLDADDAGVVGDDLGQHDGRGAAVVGDHDLHEVRGIGLSGQAGEHVRQGAVRVVRRDDDRDGPRRGPRPDRGRREDVPLVAAYDGLVAAGGHGQGHGRSRSSTSSSRLAWKPVHSRSTMPSLRKESASDLPGVLARREAAEDVAQAVGAVDPAAGGLDAAEQLGVDEAAYGPEAAHAAHHVAVGHDRPAGDEAVEDLGRVVAPGGDPELGEVDELAGHPDHVGAAVAPGEEQVDDRVRAVPVVVVDLEQHVAGRRLVRRR